VRASQVSYGPKVKSSIYLASQSRQASGLTSAFKTHSAAVRLQRVQALSKAIVNHDVQLHRDSA